MVTWFVKKLSGFTYFKFIVAVLISLVGFTLNITFINNNIFTDFYNYHSTEY